MSGSNPHPDAGPIPSGDSQARYAQAIQALNAGQWRQAQKLSMDLVRTAPNHAGVYFVAGVAALQLQQMPLAIECLRRSTTLNPQRADYLAQFARALSFARMPERAIAAANKSLALTPKDSLTLDTLGIVYTQNNEHAKAIDLFRTVVLQDPEQPGYRFNLAMALIFAGGLEQAERELEACLRLAPSYWKAHLSLAQLRKKGDEDNHLQRLRALLSDSEGNRDAALYLNLAMAKELEDIGDHAQSFVHLCNGKSAGRQTRNYSIARDESLFASIRSAYPGQVDTGFQSSEPIFVFGMPRSGTTLVERIISSHPDVHSAGELQNFSVSVKRASGSQTTELVDPETFAAARDLDWKALGEAYLSSTRPGTGKALHFIDKLPHNFLYAGLIANALPRATMVCIRRNPMDTCLSNFRQLFAQTSPYYDYSFDLLDTGRYYVLFDRLMAFWQEVMPGRIMQIDYETIVREQEPSSRRLIAHCGLEWDDACLRFEENSAPVATASAVQVRQPIYRDAVARWKHYEAQLQPLRELLETSGIDVDS